MAKVSIYSIENNTAIVYQKGTSRIVVFKDGTEDHQTFRGGKWQHAKGYLNPNFVENVKSEINK